jgi:hypothetical protein
VDQSHGRIYLFTIFGTANVPDYKVNVPETGEIGALSSIVNTRLLPALLGTDESVFSKR